MKILSHSIFISFLAASSWLSATIAPDDPNWPETYPEWWYDVNDPANGVIDATQSVLNEGNAAPLTIGQLKNIATEARDELDSVLAPVGGAGTEIDTLVDSFTTITPSNLSPANIGQLKNVSSKFFDRFAEVEFEPGGLGWPASLVLDEGNLDNTPSYPWLNNVTPENAASASIGQAKHLFSWDLRAYASYDSDFDTLPDSIEQTIIDANPDDSLTSFLDVMLHGDFDSDGLSNLREYRLGLSLIDVDSDDDGLEDGYELLNGSDPLDSNSGSAPGNDSVGPFGDIDGDRLANAMEISTGTDKDTFENVDLIKSTADAGSIGNVFITVIGKGTFELSEQDGELTLE